MKAQINQRLAARNIELIGVYVNAKTPTLFINHDCGHTWLVAPDGVLQGTGCPTCKNRKLVHGVGDNDLRLPATDPIYIIWKSMLGRCYSQKIKQEQPTYTPITCCKEWHTLSIFKAWTTSQEWEGKQLDKDLLVPGNTEYGPTKCVFVSPQINTLIHGGYKRKHALPTGVHRNGKKFSSEFNHKYLGTFSTPEEAHKAYNTARNALLKTLAFSESNPLIQNALLRHLKE